MTHGLAGSYANGCRCHPCRDAHARRIATYRRGGRSGRVGICGYCRHRRRLTASGYCSIGCARAAAREERRNDWTVRRCDCGWTYPWRLFSTPACPHCGRTGLEAVA